MSADKIQPAMTAEEWAKATGWTRQPADAASIATNYEHALAALCLHGQPFGFDREDLNAVEWAASHMEGCSDFAPGEEYREAWLDLAEDLRDLADRIAALLPPREGEP